MISARTRYFIMSHYYSVTSKPPLESNVLKYLPTKVRYMFFFSCFLLLIKFRLLSKLHGLSYCLFLQRKKKQYMQQQTCAINLSYTLHKVTVGLSSLELCYFFGLFQDVISVTLHLQIYPYVLVNKNGCTFAGYDLPVTCTYTQKHVHV